MTRSSPTTPLGAPTLFAPTPPGDRYACINLDPGERMTAGGLILTNAHQQKIMRWLVVSVGPGKWSADGSRRLAPQWKVGDVVLAPRLTTFNRIPGCALTMGRDVFVIAEDVILGSVSGVQWDSIPEVPDWREKGAEASWPGKE